MPATISSTTAGSRSGGNRPSRNYLEDYLPPRDWRRFEAHVDDCPDCHAFLGRMRATVHAPGRVRAEEAAPGTLVGLCVSFRHWRRTP